MDTTQPVLKTDYIIAVDRPDDSSDIDVLDLTVKLPGANGRILIDKVSLRISEGERIVVTGESGSGKTTVAKAIVSLWDEGSGVIAMPKESRENMMMISQKARFPNTTLRGILSMTPDHDPTFSNDELADVLKRAGHDRLIQHLPGMQVKILLEDLLDNIEEQVKSYDGQDLSKAHLNDLDEALAPVIERLVLEQFDVVQHVPEDMRETFREQLEERLMASGVHVDSRLSSELADKMTSRINRALLQPAIDHMDHIIPNIVHARNGKFGPFRPLKAALFTSIFNKRLKKRFEDYMTNKDTDEQTRIIPINDEQVKVLYEHTKDSISAEFNKQSSNSIVNRIVDLVSWPLSLVPLFFRAGSTAREVTESNTFFMERQTLKGSNMTLSGGERQRLMIARALLHRPKVLILDEITAGLDRANAQSLYKQMMDEMPADTTVISIAHDEHIWDYHTHRAHLEDQTINMQPIVK